VHRQRKAYVELKQYSCRPVAVMNEVDAIVGRLGKPMLWTDDLSGISERWPEIASCFQSPVAYQKTRTGLLSGDGIEVPAPTVIGPARANDAAGRENEETGFEIEQRN
jgi:hypothetical protein